MCDKIAMSDLMDGETLAFVRRGCVPENCSGACGINAATSAPRAITLSLGDATATIDGRPVPIEEGMAAMRKMNGEPPTRLEMLREMHTEATQDLALALAEQRPNDVHAHSVAVDACKELLTYYSTI